jgi:tetrahydromethanopterin S-methyltransferase subunit C
VSKSGQCCASARTVASVRASGCGKGVPSVNLFNLGHAIIIGIISASVM